MSINYKEIYIKSLEGLFEEDPLALGDDQGNILHVNNEFCKLTKYDRTELIGQNFNILKSGNQPDSFYKNMWKTISSGEAFRAEFCNKAKDGSIYWVDNYIAPYKGDSGKLEYFSLRASDISEKVADRVLSEYHNKSLLRVVNGHNKEEILEDLLTSLNKINPTMMCSILAREGDVLMHVAAPELPQFYIDAINGIEVGVGVGSCGEAAVTGDIVIAEDVLTHPNWINFKDLATQAGLRSCWSLPIKNGDGQVLGTFATYYNCPRVPSELDMIILRKIVSLVQVIFMSEAYKKSLKKKEESLATILDVSPVGIVELNLSGELLVINKAGKRMFDLGSVEGPSSDLEGTTFIAGDCPSKDSFDDAKQGYASRCEISKIIGNDKRHFVFRFEPLRDNKGKVTEVLLVTQDTTEEWKQTQALIKEKERAEEGNKAKSQFVANISHELRTPLNAVMGFSEILLEYPDVRKNKETLVEYLQMIFDNGKNLLHILNDIIDISSLEMNKIVMTSGETYLPDIIKEIIASMTYLKINTKIMTPLKHIDEGEFICNIDGRYVKQTLINIISNAVKASSDGGQVSIYLNVTKAHWQISVVDKGKGMTSDEIVKALKPFEVLGDVYSRQSYGTGLGLPLAKGYIEKMGGFLEINSEKDVGTEVVLLFPKIKDSKAA